MSFSHSIFCLSSLWNDALNPFWRLSGTLLSAPERTEKGTKNKTRIPCQEDLPIAQSTNASRIAFLVCRFRATHFKPNSVGFTSCGSGCRFDVPLVLDFAQSRCCLRHQARSLSERTMSLATCDRGDQQDGVLRTDTVPRRPTEKCAARPCPHSFCCQYSPIANLEYSGEVSARCSPLTLSMALNLALMGMSGFGQHQSPTCKNAVSI